MLGDLIAPFLFRTSLSHHNQTTSRDSEQTKELGMEQERARGCLQEILNADSGVEGCGGEVQGDPEWAIEIHDGL